MKDQPVTYKMLQKCARHFDVEKDREDQESSADEVVINLGLGKKMRDAAIQHVPARINEPRNFRQYGGTHPRPHWSEEQHGAQDRRRDRNDNRAVRDNQRSRWYSGLQRPAGSGDRACDFCHRLGHVSHECRSRLGLCFVCGSGAHFLRDCPDYNRPRTNVFRARSSSQPARSRGVPGPVENQPGNASTANMRQLNFRAPAQPR